MSDYNVKNFTFSAFILSVRNHWFLITAGHIIRQIEEDRKKDRRILKARIIDLASKPSIPFDYEKNLKIFADADGVDYGLIPLSDYYTNLLRKGGKEAIDESRWEQIPEGIEGFYLTGFPLDVQISNMRETSEEGSINLDFGAPCIQLFPTNKPPEELKTKNHRFYAQIPIVTGKLGDREVRLDNVEGLSGGPIFAVKKRDDGEYNYWLMAVQSGWLPSKRVIAACYILPLAKWIANQSGTT